MSTSQAKFYKANKDKVLSYKKQYYQEKNKAYIAFKKFHINGFSKRDSDKIIKNAIDNKKIYFIFNDNDTEKYNLEDFINIFDIRYDCKVNGYIENDSGGYNCNDINIDECINCISTNHELVLSIFLPVIKKSI